MILPFFLFFLSGFSALVYEIVWSRMLVLVFGNTTLATTTILAAYMAGLALGSLVWGRLIDRRPAGALRTFGYLELCIGLFALVFPTLITVASFVEVGLSNLITSNYYLLAAIRAVFCLAILLIPTFLMGGAFAVMGKHVIQDPGKFGRDAALLYGLNTAGALMGAALTGFLLLSRLGHSQTTHVAVLLNVLAGGTALLSDRWARQVPERPPTTGPSRTEEFAFSGIQVSLVMVGVGLSGGCALAYEVLWTRLLTLVVDNSIYSFTVILLAFLAGIALGSLLLGAVSARLSNPILIFALIQMGVAVAAFCVPLFIEIKPLHGSIPYYAMLMHTILFLVLLCSALLGMALPLAARIYQARQTQVGATLGTVYAVNTMGGVLGALGAGFVLIPVFGLQVSTLLLPALNGIMGGSLLVTLLKDRIRWGFAGAMALVLLLPVFLMPRGFFQQRYGQLAPGSELIFYREGLAATATVFRSPQGEKKLYFNGMPQVGTDRASMRTFKLMGALPGLVHHEPRGALVITFGAGIASGTAAHFVKRIDCVELVAEARLIASFFADENDHVLKNEKLSLHINDARHYLLTSDKTYSVIIADATHPRGYDSWVLFTEEFYSLVKERLQPDGIFCQWVPFHGMEPNQYLAIIRTFQHVFPHTSVWVVDGTYSLLMGTSGPLQIDLQTMSERFNVPAVRSDLTRAGLEDPFQMLSYFALGERGVKKMLEGFDTVITDDTSEHVFFPLSSTADDQYRKWPESNYRRIRRYQEPIMPYLTNAGDTPNQKRITLQRINRYKY